MKLDILKIEETEDGGAIITMEVDREMLHMAFERFINQAIMEKVNESLSKAEAREVVEEDGSITNTEEEDTRFVDVLAEQVFRDEVYDPHK